MTRKPKRKQARKQRNNITFVLHTYPYKRSLFCWKYLFYPISSKITNTYFTKYPILYFNTKHHCRAISKPAYTASRPTNRLRAAYRAAVSKAPPRSSAKFSLQKVEKVVKPPQKPTVRNSFRPSPSPSRRAARPHTSPINRHPTTFTAKVCSGKVVAHCSCTTRDTT